MTDRKLGKLYVKDGKLSYTAFVFEIKGVLPFNIPLSLIF